jgi:hypothetical protein
MAASRKVWWRRCVVVFAGLATLPLLLVGGGVWRWANTAPPGPPSAAPLEGRTALVKRLAPETLEQTLDNLPDFEDVAWVQGAFPSGVDGPGTYDYDFKIIPQLNRVRRLLAEGREQPVVVIPLLETRLGDSVKGYEKAYNAYIEEFNRHNKENKAWPIDSPTAYHRKATTAPACVYLLAELKSYRSLPLLAKIYQRKEMLPVSRVFLWYAMHTLALDHPRVGLTAEAAKALDDYLAATKKKVPPPKLVSVSAWNAALEETDFRAAIAGQNIGLDKQPQIQLHHYPYQLAQLENIPPWIATPQVNAWSAKLKRFIDLAYPAAGR